MDVFDLCVKITANSSEYDKALDDAKSKGESFGSKIGNAIGAAGKIAAVGITAAASGVVALGVQSVNAYKNYEQLVGGVQKLYGNMGQSLEEYVAEAEKMGTPAEEAALKWHYLEEAQTEVLNNAKQAFKTAGMSANQYMETATSFSAALINSLEGDTVAAAAQTDVAMRAISDNVNTFGTNMDAVTNAFMGFSKQNYTMLDNLKLGYGGTKTEMERLIEDANAYAEANGKAADLSIESFSDIVTAIQYIQEEQNIAGTTAREAAGTIEGSINMMKGAWENLVAGFANPDADLGQLINDFVDSASTAFNNLLPAVERALGGIATFIENVAPTLAEKLPSLIDTVLPVAINALTTFVSSLAKSLPQIVKVLVDQLPVLVGELLPAVIEALGQLAVSVIQSIPAIVTSIYEALTTAFEVGLPVLKDVGKSISETIFKGADFDKSLQNGADMISKFVDGINKELPSVVESGTNTITGFIDSVFERVPSLMETGTDIVNTLIDGYGEAYPLLFNAGLEIVSSLIKGIGSMIPTLLESLVSIGTNIFETEMGIVNDIIPNLIATVSELLTTGIETLFNGLPGALDKGVELIISFVQTIFDEIPRIFGASMLMVEAGTDIISKLISGISQSFPSLVSNVVKLISGLANTVLSNLPQFIYMLGNLAEMILSSVLELFGQLVVAIVTNIPTLVAGVVSLIAQLLAAVVSNLPAIVTAFATVLGNVLSTLVSYGAQWVSGIGKALANLISTAVKWLGQLPEKMAYYAGAATKKFLTFITELPGKVATGLSNVLQKVVEFGQKFIEEGPKRAQQFRDGLLENLASLPDRMAEIGSNLIEGLKRGVENAWQSFVNWIIDKAKGILTAWMKGFDEHSPSKEMMKIGVNVVKGLQIGMDSEFPSIDKTIEEMTNAITAPIAPTILPANTSTTNNTGYESDIERIDYMDELADAIVRAFVRADITVECDNREFGRLVRRVGVV